MAGYRAGYRAGSGAWRLWLVLACAAGLVLTFGAPASAGPSDDKQRIDQAVAETEASLEAATDRARKAVLDYTRAVEAIPGAQAALAEARGVVVGAQSAVRQADREAAEAKAAADTAASAYQAAAVEVERVRDEISTLISSVYRGSDFFMINAILDSQNPADFLNSAGYLDRVIETRQAALAEYVDRRAQARQRSDLADAARAVAARTAATARRALEEAQAKQAAAERAATALQTLADERESAAAVAESERGAVLARYNELAAESERLAAELRAAAAAHSGGPQDVPSVDSGGFFTMPVSGRKSSNFGQRFDPYYHVWQLHAGVDYAAGGGSPIVAAGNGKVVRAGRAGGYGNYTCIYHGNYQGRGLTTCYGHQSAILVSVGQTVRRGELIGRVGTTGASTGNHLHFEVRLNGTPVNPLGWL